MVVFLVMAVAEIENSGVRLAPFGVLELVGVEAVAGPDPTAVVGADAAAAGQFGVASPLVFHACVYAFSSELAVKRPYYTQGT